MPAGDGGLTPMAPDQSNLGAIDATQPSIVGGSARSGGMSAESVAYLQLIHLELEGLSNHGSASIDIERKLHCAC